MLGDRSGGEGGGNSCEAIVRIGRGQALEDPCRLRVVRWRGEALELAEFLLAFGCGRTKRIDGGPGLKVGRVVSSDCKYWICAVRCDCDGGDPVEHRFGGKNRIGGKGTGMGGPARAP